MRLIDADKVMFTNFEIVMCEGDFKQAFKLLCEKLDNALTVDAIPVEWIKEYLNNGVDCHISEMLDNWEKEKE